MKSKLATVKTLSALNPTENLILLLTLSSLVTFNFPLINPPKYEARALAKDGTMPPYKPAFQAEVLKYTCHFKFNYQMRLSVFTHQTLFSQFSKNMFHAYFHKFKLLYNIQE